MPTVTLNKEVFEKLVGKKLPLEKLKDRISYIGTDLESIEGNEIKVEIFPNRPDLLSEQGFARAFSSFIGVKTGLRKYEVTDSKEKVIIDKSVANVRPYTACAIVKNMKFDDEKIKEVIQIQEKLHVTYGRNRKKAAIGIYPYEKIKPPITFIAKKPDEIKFRPLEAPKEMSGKQILSQTSTGREYAHLLEGYDTYPIFVDSEGDILSMTPITNSHNTGKITEKTTDVFIECSGFDFRVLQKCINIITTAFEEMGGKIYSMTLEYPDKNYTTPDLTPEKMKVDIKYINTRLGLDLKEKDVKELLEKMGYGYEKGYALIPAYRADILHQIDLAEDIAIAYGFENFKAEIPQCATIGNESKFEIFKNKIANILAGLNLLEVNTYNITNHEFQTKKMDTDMKLVKLKNALSKEYDTLRAWVIPTMMEILSNNKHNEYPQNIFGFGTIFKKNNKTETGIEENDRLAVALCKETVDYTQIKQIFDYLCENLDLKYEIEETDSPAFIDGRCARISINGKKVAYLGEISPKVLENWDLEYPVAVFELNVTELFETMSL